jgi:hypothetical protein
MSSLTLPTWGGLHAGVLYELPTPERPTIEHGYSSLPTPQARDYKDQTLPNPHGQHSPSLPIALKVLPTPTAQAAKHGSTPDIHAQGFGSNLWDLPHLLPTPAVNDMGAGKDPQAWAEWAARQKAADGRPAPHGKSLEQEALKMLPTPNCMDAIGERSDEALARAKTKGGCSNLKDVLPRLGVNTHQPLTAGSTSLDEPHQAQLFSETSETD